MHPSRRGRRLGGGGVGWWMGLPVHLCGRGGPPAGLPCGSQIPTYLSLGVRSLRDLDHHVTACSEGARACGGGGGAGPAFGPAPFLLGGVGAAKGLLPCFLVPKGNQPTACTLALWWLKFGPTESKGGGGAFSWDSAGKICRKFFGVSTSRSVRYGCESSAPDVVSIRQNGEIR